MSEASGSVRRGETAQHAWHVAVSQTPGRFDAYVFHKHGGTSRAEYVGYFQSVEDAAKAAIESALVLDGLAP